MRIKHTWSNVAPGTEPKLYTTCLSSALYTALRWWDGQEWWDISATRGSPARPFKWPKGAAANGVKQPGWMKRYPALALRKITDQSKVRWGTPYKHFDQVEVLHWLIKQGRLPADWPEAFQQEMRAQSAVQPPALPTTQP